MSVSICVCLFDWTDRHRQTTENVIISHGVNRVTSFVTIHRVLLARSMHLGGDLRNVCHSRRYALV